MKVRESGMPQEELWDTFFETQKILTTLGLKNDTQNVAEFGCGYGTFTIPTAKIINGKVYTFDIETEMIQITKEKVNKNKLTNVEVILKDFITQGTGLPDKSINYAMLFNILHTEQPETLLKEANRILKPSGKIGIIHWNHDPTTPRGPPIKIRPTIEQCIKWATNTGFENPKVHDLKPYHYGITMEKTR